MSEMPFLKREDGSGGVREVMAIAFPLIMSASSIAIKLFTDRVMLAQYSSEALSASFSSGIICFGTGTLFLGTAGYASAFVAQYTGARRHEHVGTSVWQGMYLALIGGLVLALSTLLAEPLFNAIGHTPYTRFLEIKYFKIVNGAALFFLMIESVMAFWSGRGKTWVVCGVSASTCVVNVALNYVLIFGKFGFPEMGIAGAALGTVYSNVFGVVLALYLFWRPCNLKQFDTFPKKTFDPELFWRLIRFGLPNGIHFVLDVTAFNVIVQIMGLMGKAEHEAATIAFSMNAIAFIPMIGLGMTTSILVGQSIGAKDIDHAWRAVKSSRSIVLCYMAVLVLAFVLFPGIFVSMFARGDGAQQATLDMAERMLSYIAAYLLFDGMYIVYASAIKGAGDTKFAMWTGVLMAWVFMALPSIAAYWLGYSIWFIWSFMVGYVVLAGIVFYLRYRGGKWTKMRVIES